MSLTLEARRVLILGLLACVLGGYTYLTTPQKQLTRQQQEEAAGKRPLFAFAPQDVTQIEVFFRQQRLVFQRTREGWTHSQGTPIRTEVVQDFLSNLVKLVQLGALEGVNQELAEYGLDPPEASITVQLGDAVSYSLSLGKRNPVQSSLYAQVNEAPQVVLVGAVVVWDMRKLFTAAHQSG